MNLPNARPPTLTTDIVPFAIRGERLEVLLARQTTGWGLPGGPVGVDEDLDVAARRQLAEQTGLPEVYLEQLYTFGRPNRDPVRRMVAVAYFALIPIASGLAGTPATGDAVRWAAVDGLPLLVLDHGEIVAVARRRLAAKLLYSTIALQLMPERFTLSELQAVHEIILGEPLDKRNFRKRVLTLDCIEATGELARHSGRRPAQLYRAQHPGQVELIR
ncbi:MAG: NUDIX domain-containing protein [Candidatus Competibacter sp.]